MLIELDDAAIAPQDYEPQRPQWTVRQRLRAVRYALVGLLVLVLAGSAPFPLSRARPLLLLTPTRTQFDMALVNDLLVVADNQSVSAYGLDGRRLWSTALRNPARSIVRKLVDGALVIAFGGTDVVLGNMAGLDPGSGKVLWRWDGMAQVVGDHVLTYPDSGGFEVRDAQTLRVKWSDPVNVASLADDDSDVLWTVNDQGQVAERELASGAVLRMASAQSLSGRLVNLDRVGDRLRVVDSSEAFSANRATEVAQVVLDLETFQPVDESVPWGLWQDCDTVLCAYYPGATVRSVVDKRTGKVLWTHDLDSFPFPTTAGLLLLRDAGLSSEHSVAGFYDPMTGKLRFQARGWMAIDDDPFGRGALAPLLIRPERTDLTFVGRLDKDGIELLGTLPFTMQRCSVAMPLLACVTSDNRITVSRIVETSS